jgi:hypothetical protein
MNSLYKQPWLDALRSGKFDQGCTYLKRKRKDTIVHCCLGVLEDINGRIKNETYSLDRGLYGNCNLDLGFYNTVDNTNYTLSVDALKKYGISSIALNQLIGMNDGGRSFDEIADWIEKNL